MSHVWFALANCPEEGRWVHVTDPAVWAEPLNEFHIPAQVTEPLQAELFLLPQKEGLLIRGHLQGTVSLQCDRCMQPAVWAMDVRFDVFESPAGEEGGSEGDEDRFRQGREGLELDLAAVLWEQFVLDLPVKPLCTEKCQGVCPQCGANLNLGGCGCDLSTLDPRLEVLRRLKVDNH